MVQFINISQRWGDHNKKTRRYADPGDADVSWATGKFFSFLISYTEHTMVNDSDG
jgi:hypothetical protein